MADDKDDLLNPEEIEALLNSSGPLGAPRATPPGGAAQGAPKPAGGLKDILNSSDIESLLQQRDRSNPLGGLEGTEELLNRAEADLAAAISPDLERSRASASRLAAAKPFEFEQFGSSEESTDQLALTALQEVELDLRIELGRTELLIEEVLKLREGSVVPLDKLAGDPVDILVNGRLIARGEVLVLNDNFCVRIAEILTPDFQ